MRLVRTASAAALAVALLAGCSDGGQASETLPSASSSAAETSEALPPLGPPDMPMPAEAREQTEAGAIAAGQYFLRLTVRAYQQGDPAPVTELSSGCEYCDTLVTGVREDTAAGNRIFGGDLSFQDAGQATLDGDRAEVAFSVEQSPLSVVGPDGSEVTDRAQPGFKVFTALAATWNDRLRAWTVTQVTIS